jgi:hypothetical protein
MKQPQPAADNDRSGDNKRPAWFIKWLCLVAGVLVGFFTAVAIFLPEITERWKFIATTLFSFLALIVIVAQAIIYRKQSQIMTGQWRAIASQANSMELQTSALLLQAQAAIQSVEAMREQAATTQHQLSVMSTQADTMFETLKTEQRAYIGISRMNIDLAKTKRLTIHLTNTGKTPASKIKANVSVSISTPMHWHERQPENVRIFCYEGEDYDFNLTEVFPSSIPARIDFPLGLHFSTEELTLVAQKESHLTVNINLEYWDGFAQGLSYYVLTYRGKDTHGNDSWGIFPTASEKQYDQENPDRSDWREIY